MMLLQQPSDNTNDMLTVRLSKPSRTATRLIMKFYDQDHSVDAMIQASRLIVNELAVNGAGTGDNFIQQTSPIELQRQWMRTRNGGTSYTVGGYLFSHYDSAHYWFTALASGMNILYSTGSPPDYSTSSPIFRLTTVGHLATAGGFGFLSDNVGDIGASSYRAKDIYAGGYLRADKNVMFRAYRSVAQTINASTVTTIQFNTESFDPNSVFDTGSYSFSAPVNGTYLIIAQVPIQSMASGKYAYMQIMQGGGARATVYKDAEVGGGITNLQASTIVRLTAGNTVTVVVYHNDTVGRNTDTGEGSIHFEAHLLNNG